MISFLTSRLSRLTKAFQYSMQGFRVALKQRPFQEELVACTILVPLACWLDISLVKTLLLIGSLISVLVAELLNTAIEAAIDRVGPERHIFSGMAKDLGSAAVLLCIFWAAVVWICILWSM